MSQAITYRPANPNTEATRTIPAQDSSIIFTYSAEYNLDGTDLFQALAEAAAANKPITVPLDCFNFAYQVYRGANIPQAMIESVIGQ